MTEFLFEVWLWLRGDIPTYLPTTTLGFWLDHPYCTECHAYQALQSWTDVLILARSARAVCLDLYKE